MTEIKDELNKSFSTPTLEEIVSSLPNNRALTEEELEILVKAFDFSKKFHEGQTRNSGEPYFNHCVQTAKNIARQNMDIDTIAAGLLHDTLEDTKATKVDKLNCVQVCNKDTKVDGVLQ